MKHLFYYCIILLYFSTNMIQNNLQALCSQTLCPLSVIDCTILKNPTTPSYDTKLPLFLSELDQLFTSVKIEEQTLLQEARNISKSPLFSDLKALVINIKSYIVIITPIDVFLFVPTKPQNNPALLSLLQDFSIDYTSNPHKKWKRIDNEKRTDFLKKLWEDYKRQNLNLSPPPTITKNIEYTTINRTYVIHQRTFNGMQKHLSSLKSNFNIQVQFVFQDRKSQIIDLFSGLSPFIEQQTIAYGMFNRSDPFFREGSIRLFISYKENPHPVPTDVKKMITNFFSWYFSDKECMQAENIRTEDDAIFQISPKKHAELLQRIRTLLGRNIRYTINSNEAQDYESLDAIASNKLLSLCLMERNNIPTPPFFGLKKERNVLITPEEKEIIKEFRENIAFLEQNTKKQFGGDKNPLIVSVRSGSEVSMPGLMETFLNIGITRKNLPTLISNYGKMNAYQIYHRMLVRLISTKLNLTTKEALVKSFTYFPCNLDPQKDLPYQFPFTEDENLTLNRYLALYNNSSPKKPFPLDDAFEQLLFASNLVINSFNNITVQRFIKDRGLTTSGTSVIVQAMALGNLNNFSCSGVCYSYQLLDTNNSDYFYEWSYSQGEEVVNGAMQTTKLYHNAPFQLDSLFKKYLTILEQIYKGPVEIEFTIENGKLWLLQSRLAVSSAESRAKILIKLAEHGELPQEKLFDTDLLTWMLQESQTMQVAPDHKNTFFIYADKGKIVPGAVSGIVCFSPADAIPYLLNGNDIILVTALFSFKDICFLMHPNVRGLITGTGGVGAHNAIIGRMLHKPTMVYDGIKISDDRKHAHFQHPQGSTKTLHSGQIATIEIEQKSDYAKIYLGEKPLKKASYPPTLKDYFIRAYKYYLNISASFQTLKAQHSKLEENLKRASVKPPEIKDLEELLIETLNMGLPIENITKAISKLESNLDHTKKHEIKEQIKKAEIEMYKLQHIQTFFEENILDSLQKILLELIDQYTQDLKEIINLLKHTPATKKTKDIQQKILTNQHLFKAP